MDLMLDAVCVVDKGGYFMYVNAAFERIFGYSPEEIIGTPMLNLVFPDDRKKTLDTVDEILAGEEKLNFENRWVRKDGRIVHILWSAHWSEIHQARIAVARDISDRKELELRLAHMAQHDPLTDLPNRTLFLDRLQTGLQRARRDAAGLALLFIDLDMFKGVNDRYGHAIGDHLLKEIADRLRSCVRESDTIGRIGGDEFLVLLNNIQISEHALITAEKIRTVLTQRCEIGGHSLQISPSVGIALFPDHGNDEQQLLQRADEAMYKAKLSGGNCLQLFQSVSAV